VVSRGSDAIVVYPAYFDVRRSQGEGRRVPRKLAVENPTVEAITRAAQGLGLKAKVEGGKAHSATPWKREGRVLVITGDAKEEVLRKIAVKMKAVSP
jgi:signal recognition particle subunit SRP19